MVKGSFRNKDSLGGNKTKTMAIVFLCTFCFCFCLSWTTFSQLGTDGFYHLHLTLFLHLLFIFLSLMLQWFKLGFIFSLLPRTKNSLFSLFSSPSKASHPFSIFLVAGLEVHVNLFCLK